VILRLSVIGLAPVLACLAQDSVVGLQVCVRDEAGVAVAGARISVVAASGRLQREALSDNSGCAVTRDFPFGAYEISASARGLADQRVAVQLTSAQPQPVQLTLAVASVRTEIEVEASGQAADPSQPLAGYTADKRLLQQYIPAQPGRRILDQVAAQPGWTYEDSGVLHPRASEYDVQFVLNGLPITDRRAPGKTPMFDDRTVQEMRMLTSGFPAEYGRKLGGVVDISTTKNTVEGLHGTVDAGGGSFGATESGVGLDFGAGRNAFSLSTRADRSERYLDPPVIANYSNKGSSLSSSASYSREIPANARLRLNFARGAVRAETPNERIQELAGQRQDHTATETSAGVAYEDVIGNAILLSAQVNLRETSFRVWSNDRSTPIAVWQERRLRETYARVSAAGHHGRHDWKIGADGIGATIREFMSYIITNPSQIEESAAPAFLFSGQSPDREAAVFAQDRVALGTWSIAAGLRFDTYHLVTHEAAWSPRLAVTKYIPVIGTTVHAFYDRVFQTPAVENLLVASSPEAANLSNGAFRLPLRPATANFYEAGMSRRISGATRAQVNLYRRDFRNCPDDELLLNTGIDIPIAFARATIIGTEVKIDAPEWKGLSGWVSYANETAIGQGPVTGGLFLGEADLVEARFSLSQDQRNGLHALVGRQLGERWRGSLQWSWGSGLPVEASGADYDFLVAQYGRRVLDRVNFNRGRVRPNSSLDGSIAYEAPLGRQSALSFQIQVSNILNATNVINFAGLFSGTTIGPPRAVNGRISYRF
jgi:hypothetical protein